MLRNLRAVADAGIPIVMGTDAGNIGTLHGPSVFREMALMHQAGLTPLEVLRAATVNGARAMHRDREIGTIAPGRLADFVVLDADPTASVENLSRIHRVVKDGTLYDPDALISRFASARSPGDPVHRPTRARVRARRATLRVAQHRACHRRSDDGSSCRRQR